MTSFNLRFALLGLLSLSVALGASGCKSNKNRGDCSSGACCADSNAKCVETRIEMKDLPAPVKATLDRESAGGTVTELEKCTKGNETCYCADATIGGKEYELCISPDGTLLKKALDKD